MFVLGKGPFLPSNNGNNEIVEKSTGFLSDNYGGYLTPAQTQFAKGIGRGTIAVEILAWADKERIPNQYSFIKDTLGYVFAKPENKAKYEQHFMSTFGTLGNGRLEWNDVLAMPINFWAPKMFKRVKNKVDERVNKSSTNKPNSDDSKTGEKGGSYGQ